ncbi:hypothetical protein BD410DRAFT_786177 [Rickenella mellea]|uniref:Uncharacterized protein n=1 Tax=Rickenella mellea TaxID=50990 RepID=A0A4Y7QAG2_9AGAM|nr:hypothetical protein BD410DRAFT_786177 [Rickenella mellea]
MSLDVALLETVVVIAFLCSPFQSMHSLCLSSTYVRRILTRCHQIYDRSKSFLALGRSGGTTASTADADATRSNELPPVTGSADVGTTAEALGRRVNTGASNDLRFSVAFVGAEQIETSDAEENDDEALQATIQTCEFDGYESAAESLFQSSPRHPQFLIRRMATFSRDQPQHLPRRRKPRTRTRQLRSPPAERVARTQRMSFLIPAVCSFYFIHGL